MWHPVWHLKVENRPQNRHQTYNIQNSGRLNSEKETFLWRTHGMIGISLKRHQQWRLLIQDSVSGVVTEPHHADPMLQEVLSKEGAIVTDEIDDIREDTIVTRGVVVIAMVVET